MDTFVMDRRRRYSIARCASLEAMKANEHEFWRRRPGHE